MVSIKGSDIKHNGSKIGDIKRVGNTLTDINIYRKYRGNNYSPKVVDEFIKEVKQENYSYAQTTCVVHPGLEKVLKRRGFEKASGKEINVPKKIKHSSGVTIPQNTKPLNTDNSWILIF